MGKRYVYNNFIGFCMRATKRNAMQCISEQIMSLNGRLISLAQILFNPLQIHASGTVWKNLS